MPSSGSTTSRMASVSVSTDGSTGDPAGGAPVVAANIVAADLVAADIVAADIVVSVTERSPRASVRSALSGRRRARRVRAVGRRAGMDVNSGGGRVLPGHPAQQRALHPGRIAGHPGERDGVLQ